MDFYSMLALVAAITGIGLMLLNGTARANRLRRADPLREVRTEQLRSSSSPQGLVRDMEVRLHDFGRGIEARIENQLVVLDRLILDADREIARLEGMLAETRQDWPTDRALSRGEQQRCFALREAGFSVEETARCLNTTSAAVEAALNEWERPDRRAA